MNDKNQKKKRDIKDMGNELFYMREGKNKSAVER